MKKFLLMFTLVGLVIFGCNYSYAANGITYNNNLTTRTDLNGNSFSYGTITIEHNGDSITMMDRNLGATTNNINSSRSYGYHYQWGNNYGFTHPGINGIDEITDNATTRSVTTANQYGPTTSWYFGSTFIEATTSSNDWANPSNDNLRGGSGDSEDNNRGYNTGTMTVINVTDRQGPCPDGYHVPSIGEWRALMDLYSNSSTDGFLRYSDNFKNTFKLPLAGNRYGVDARVNEVGIWADFWSSSPNIYVDSSAWRLYMDPEGEINANYSSMRTNGHSVRCFKNPDNENTSSSQGNNSNSNFEYDTLRFNPYYSDEMNMAYQYSRYYDITTANNIKEADMNGGLNRIAMAKMLSYFAENVLGIDDFDTRRNCNFIDVPTYLDRQYNYGVTKACQLGIMGINMPDNKFYPNGGVTRAEFATALSRLLYGTRDGTDVYYSTHISKLYREGIISNTNPNLQEKRGYVMLMLMRSQDGGSTSNNNNSSTTYHSPNMIDITPFLHLSNVDTTCNWTDRTINERYGNYYIYVPNSTWAADARFVNNALQDIRNNGEYLVQNYITQANNVLDSNSLTNRDRCKYSFLIYALENQKGELTSYKTENGITTIGVDFYSYKETLDEYDRDPAGGTFGIYKNTSTKSRNYRLAENPQLEILKVDSNGYTNAVYYFDAPGTRSYISNWNTWINTYCNNEIVYNGKSPDPNSNISNYNWNTNNALCIKNRLSNPGDRSLTFTFNNLGNISKIGGFYYWLDFHS